MNKTNWTLIAIIAVIVLLILLIGAGSFGGMMGPGMMGGWSFAPFGWLGMIFMWLVPLSFVALLVVSIVWLLGARNNASHHDPQTPPATGTCPDCGRPTQTDWQYCPYCKQKLV